MPFPSGRSLTLRESGVLLSGWFPAGPVTILSLSEAAPQWQVLRAETLGLADEDKEHGYI